VKAGFVAYHSYCGVCHGDAAVGGGILPDLRHSSAVQDAARFKRIVIEGSLANSGMISWSSVLTPDAAESVRAYIVSRANDEIAPPPPPAAAAPAKPAAASAKPAKAAAKPAEAKPAAAPAKPAEAKPAAAPAKP
jgi:mono/diheme cytochrome c family protein